MAPKRLRDDPPPAEDSDDETVNEEVEEDPVESEFATAKSGGDNDEEEEEEVEEEEEEEEEEEDDNEEEKENPFANKTHVTSSSAVSNSNPKSVSAPEDDSGSGSDSETESDNTNQSPKASDFTIKPIVSKSNKNIPPAKPCSSSPASKTGVKRPVETEPNPKDSKKKKVTNGAEDEDGKKGRLWREIDEIAVLKGLVEYQAKNGPVVLASIGEFHESIRKDLQAHVKEGQLNDKIKRLKKKYQDNVKKGENGEDPVFSKSHERKSFELSKKIWGVDANGVDDNAKGGSKRKPPRKSNSKVTNVATVLALPVSDGVAEKKAEKKEEVNVANDGGVKVHVADGFWSKYPCLSDSLRMDKFSPKSDDLTRIMVQRMPLIGCSKAQDLEERWRELQLIEMDLSAKKLALMQEQAKLVLDSMKSSKD